jgi:hypothetical protein
MRASWVIGLLLTALVLAGPAAARDPKDPQQRHTAADTRLANTLALHQKDLAAGWTQERPPADPPPCKTEPDESNLVQTARIDPTFIWKDGITNLGTEVDIFKTAAMAQRDWDLSTLKLFQSCLLQSAHDQLPHDKVTLVSSKKLPRPSAVAERSLHYRLVFDINHAGKTVPVVSDVTALGRGRETVVMHSFSVGIPLPSSAVTQLVQILANRLGTGGI